VREANGVPATVLFPAPAFPPATTSTVTFFTLGMGAVGSDLLYEGSAAARVENVWEPIDVRGMGNRPELTSG
jgi:hypothetical protein